MKYIISNNSLYFKGISTDTYPVLTSECKGIVRLLKRDLRRDPLDTPRQIGFTAKHKK